MRAIRLRWDACVVNDGPCDLEQDARPVSYFDGRLGVVNSKWNFRVVGRSRQLARTLVTQLLERGGLRRREVDFLRPG